MIISDAPNWSIIYDSKTFIVQATGAYPYSKCNIHFNKALLKNIRLFCSKIEMDRQFYFLTIMELTPKHKLLCHDIRKRADRKALQAFECAECRNYYSGANLNEDQLRDLLQQCSRHRSKNPPPAATPQVCWELDIRDDSSQNKTQVSVSLFFPSLSLCYLCYNFLTLVFNSSVK